jgi:hypothetical protein
VLQVDRVLAEKKAMYEQAKKEQEAWDAQQLAQEERELDLVECERRRLLRDNAELLDYFPKGVLRNREDLDFVLGLAQELKQKGKIC